MRLASVRPGDIVLADVKGRRFYAHVVAKDGRELQIKPLAQGVSYRVVKAHQVLTLFRRARRELTPG